MGFSFYTSLSRQFLLDSRIPAKLFFVSLRAKTDAILFFFLNGVTIDSGYWIQAIEMYDIFINIISRVSCSWSRFHYSQFSPLFITHHCEVLINLSLDTFPNEIRNLKWVSQWPKNSSYIAHWKMPDFSIYWCFLLLFFSSQNPKSKIKIFWFLLINGTGSFKYSQGSSSSTSLWNFRQKIQKHSGDEKRIRE